jgi:phosphatidate cytidylyltransferase
VLRTRVLSAVILLPVVCLFVYLGGIPWLIGMLLTGIVAWWEMHQLLRRNQFVVGRILGLVFVLCAIGEAYVSSLRLLPVDLLRPLLVAFIIASLIWALYDKSEHPTADWGVTVGGALYLGLSLGYFVTLRQRSNGLYWVAVAFAVTWIYDSAAYFVGSALGRHKLWPRLSPKKTWEGLAGGSVAAVIGALLLGTWLLGLTPWYGLLLGVLIAAADPFGDFAMSLFKRMAHIKDTGSLIPGHGGILDRLDSLLFAFPLVTLFAVIVAGA